MVLDLRLARVRKTLGLPSKEPASIHPSESQIIGEIARAFEINAIVAPSVTGEGAMIAIFPELISRSAWEFHNMEIWVGMMDIPGAPEFESPRAWDDRMTM
jgi:hypothetical protein